MPWIISPANRTIISSSYCCFSAALISGVWPAVCSAIAAGRFFYCGKLLSSFKLWHFFDHGIPVIISPTKSLREADMFRLSVRGGRTTRQHKYCTQRYNNNPNMSRRNMAQLVSLESINNAYRIIKESSLVRRTPLVGGFQLPTNGGESIDILMKLENIQVMVRTCQRSLLMALFEPFL